ncbi:MFS transporter [bacterium]|nr:MFS transporter [bacterium]
MIAKSEEKLFNFGFVTLNFFVLFSFCNLAVFYSFYNFLATLPIPKQWHGILIGLISASALILRPFIISRLTVRNAIRGVIIGIVLIVISLLSYSHANTLLPMFLLRIMHGVAYVTLMSSAITMLMIFIPAKKSGQGFAIISVMTLLPYAVIPLILESSYAANIHMTNVYSFTAFFMIPPLFLLIPLSKHLKSHVSGNSKIADKLPKGSLWLNIKQPKILCLLGANGLLFAVFSLIFFFLKTFCAESGFGNPGIFFTIFTGVMIGIRVLLGPMFDKFNKAPMTIISFIILAVGLFLLRSVESTFRFYSAAVIYGIGVGAAAPLMNGMMFNISSPVYRGLNTNLMMEMIDLGFFLGPAICGFALSTGFSQANIISVCIGAIVMAAFLMIPMIKENYIKEGK